MSDQNTTVKQISIPTGPSNVSGSDTAPVYKQPEMPEMPKRPNEGIGGRHPNHPKEHK